MSVVLGVSGLHHDAAAALVIDGEIVVAVQEERLTRIKHDAQLPLQSARACLSFAGLDAGALDAVVFYENPYAKLEQVMTTSLRRAPFGVGHFPGAVAAQLGSKLWVLDALSSLLGVSREKVRHGHHHHSHAASAFYPSPFASAAVLTIDGIGEQVCSALWHGQGNTLTCVEEQHFPHSLGLLYAAITSYLGFEVNDGEYKVMGLAAYGDPCHRDDFARFVTVHDDGSITLEPSTFAHFESDVGFGAKLEALLGPRRRHRQPFDFNEDDSKRAANIAATLQAITEDAVIAMARHARARTGADALCMAGGVALNCVANARIAKEAGFSSVWVQPAATDAGGALGAALAMAIELGDKRSSPMTHAALGLPVDMSVLTTTATALGIGHHRCEPIETATKALLHNQVVAWVQGRHEWGPRALGHRSILALPATVDIKERVNRVIKKREPFRPFAPAVLSSHVSNFFDGRACAMTPFMTTTRKVLPNHIDRLPAITHVDSTARVQSVDGDGPFAKLLAAVGQATGVPMLLNTSLNGGGEPMVAGAEDCLAFFLSHPVDVMIVEDVTLQRGQ
jgi:carbamoyltransferase